MKNKHTPKTLRKYLFEDVYVIRDGKWGHKVMFSGFAAGGTLARIEWVINEDHDYKNAEKKKDVQPLENIYPILKTVDDLIDALGDGRNWYSNSDPFILIEKGYDDFDNGDYYHGEKTFDGGVWLLENGYGAIPNEDSPTGYVDLFGNPCVTPKQVEEGIDV